MCTTFQLNFSFVSYYDDFTLLKIISNKELWLCAAAEINVELLIRGDDNSLNLNPLKFHSISVPLKHDIEKYPSLIINYVLIGESKMLSTIILEIFKVKNFSWVSLPHEN